MHSCAGSGGERERHRETETKRRGERQRKRDRKRQGTLAQRLVPVQGGGPLTTHIFPKLCQAPDNRDQLLHPGSP